MSKLYPPQIAGTIPAFYGSVLTVPFTMNKTVSWNEISGFRIKLKSVSNNELILYKQVNLSLGEYINQDKTEIYFPLDSESIKSLKKGTFYKLQLAYTDSKEQDGYFSTVGIVKYTSKPTLEISGLDQGTLSSAMSKYVGFYSQEEKDATEKVYSYRFDIRDGYNTLVETSGNLVHNHENDEYSYESYDSYAIKSNLEDNQVYTIQYTVITTNGLEISTPCYRIVKQTTVNAEIQAELVVSMNEENGYIDIQLIGQKDAEGIEKVGTGTFLICRSSSEDSYGSWSEVCRFALYGDAPSNYHWRDFTVQHGYDYIYSLQQYNVEYQIYSNRMLSNTITANFEHSFLFDGKRQLKIKYNPKVSSFKINVLETKTNTIGGQYPFFFRNGNVNYKEFPISGLISYLSDEEELFLTNEDLLLDDYSNLTRQHTLNNSITSKENSYFENMLDANLAYKLQNEYRAREGVNSNEKLISNQKLRTTNIENYNITAERIFKMKVLEWLNNGEPKLFRSPAEGNFIVRLMNSSLTPNDQLSRMIHTFSTTATEIDDYNYEKLNDYDMIEIADPVVKQLRWKTIQLMDLINDNGGTKITEKKAQIIKEKEKTLTNIDNNTSLTESEKATKKKATITTYDSLLEELEKGELSIGSENNIITMQCLDMAPGDKIHIYYSGYREDEKQIRTIEIGITGAYYVKFDEAPVKITIDRTSGQGQITYSYYGTSLHHFDTYRAINMSDFPVKQFIGSTDGEDILNQLQDIKYKVTKYNFLNFVKRPIEIAYDTAEIVNPLVIYQINDIYYDGNTKKVIDDYQCKFWVDDREVDLTETGDLYLSDFEVIPKVVLGNGVSLDASIQRREIEYDVEENDTEVVQAKNAYIEVLDNLKALVKIETMDDYNTVKDYEEALEELQSNVVSTYQKFNEALTAALKAKEVLDIE